MRYFLLVFLVGCTSGPSGPDVVLVYDASVPTAEQEYLRAGVEEWSGLGFNLVDSSDQPECDRLWYANGETDCAITIVISKDDLNIGGTEYAGLASRDQRTVILSTLTNTSSYAKRMELWALATHEIGHILLDTGHLDPSVRGVMSGPYPKGDDEGHTPTQADYDRACESIGVCL